MARVTRSVAKEPAPDGVRKIESRIAEPPEPGANGLGEPRVMLRRWGPAASGTRSGAIVSGSEATPVSWPLIEASGCPSTLTCTAGMISPWSHNSHTPAWGSANVLASRPRRAITSPRRVLAQAGCEALATSTGTSSGASAATSRAPRGVAVWARRPMAEHWRGSPPAGPL